MSIVNNTCNDVAVTTLPSAPLDAYGMPTVTWALATAGGVSVIKDDGTVVDSAETLTMANVGFTSEGGLWYSRTVGTYLVWYATKADYLAGDGFGDRVGSSAIGTEEFDLLTDHREFVVSSEYLDAAGSTSAGTVIPSLMRQIPNYSDFTAGLSSRITSSYNTGWMFSDVKGAFLSDTTAETVGVDETTELVTNGAFTSDISGWTAGDAETTLSWNAGVIRITNGDASPAYAKQVLSGLTIGQVYSISVDVIAKAASRSAARLVINPAPMYDSGETLGVGSHTITFKATATSHDLLLSNGIAGIVSEYTEWDNISVKQTGNLVVNGTFDVDTSGWQSFRGATLAYNSGALDITFPNPSDWAGAVQPVPTVIGETYVVTGTVTSNSTSEFVRMTKTDSSTAHTSLVVTENISGVGVSTLTFTATATTSYIGFAHATSTDPSGGTITVDNISVRLAEEDRSVNNGLEVHGQITKAAVATGADLVAYSGWTNSDYLEQPYNADLDFGTGDFYVCGWVDLAAGDTGFMFYRGDSVTTYPRILFSQNSGIPRFYTQDAASLGSYQDGTTDIRSVGWAFITGVRSGGTLYCYVNGVLENGASTTPTTARNITSVAPSQNVMSLGGAYSAGTKTDTLLSGSKLALWRIGAGAPTAADILKIYNDERPLFTDGAQATLFGSSDAITALAFDPVTDLLSVGTSAGRSDFSGLRRVSNTTTAVTTAISAYDSLIIEQ